MNENVFKFYSSDFDCRNIFVDLAQERGIVAFRNAVQEFLLDSEFGLEPYTVGKLTIIV